MKIDIYAIASLLIPFVLLLFFYSGISEQGYGELGFFSYVPQEYLGLISLISLSVSACLFYFVFSRHIKKPEAFLLSLMVATTPPLFLSSTFLLSGNFLTAFLLSAIGFYLMESRFFTLSFIPFIGMVCLYPASFFIPLTLAAYNYFSKGWASLLYLIPAFFLFLSLEFPIYLPYWFAPFIAFSIPLLFEKTEERLLFAGSLISMFFPMGFPLILFSSVLGIKYLVKRGLKIPHLLFMFLAFLSFAFVSFDPLKGAIIGLFAFILFYPVALLYNLKYEQIFHLVFSALVILSLFTAFSLSSARSVDGEKIIIPSEETLSLYSSEKGAVLAYSNTYSYLSGENPVLLNKTTAGIKRVLVSSDSLDLYFEGSPAIFSYTGTTTHNEKTYAQFSNSMYVLLMLPSGEELALADALLFSNIGGTKIPFTHVFLLDNELPFYSPDNRVILREGIENTPFEEVFAWTLKKVADGQYIFER
ncbi:hypothetical protein KAW38_02305 [Candidatus Micrarchaeota archaeon]|nr:hypothetical protein [Candidatus Micrarchaeota archaeon]